MGSIDERKAIDASIGGLVWVRRRNGSWWPGRIMAHHEVPDKSIVSPKSGTPIKLLGREDASVDWYNLDKSKRVKAFRCGEYDACIETAKATASTTAKKAVKYARREDAIVHALQIENAHLAKASKLKRRRTPQDQPPKRMRGLHDIAMAFQTDANVNAYDYSKRKNPQHPLETMSETKVSALINLDSNGVSCENCAVSLDASEHVVEAIHSKAKESDISSISVLAEDDSPKGAFDDPLTAGISTAAFTSSSPRKALDSGTARQCRQSSHGDALENGGSNGTSPVNALPDGIEKSISNWQLKGKRNARQMSKKQEERRNAFAQEANNNSLLRATVSDQNRHGHFSVGTQAMGLYDVMIEVKASYKPQDVPLISLRSKLSGEAIIGHPLTVEVSEDGSCNPIVSTHIKLLGVPIVDDDVKPKPSWKKKSKSRKLVIPLHKSSKSKKAQSPSKKTRFLSALSGQKLTVGTKKMVVTEKGKEPIVACIPLKVVFSRINEAVKGSARQGHKTLPSAGNTE